MNGPQLKTWRESAGLTMRGMADTVLTGQVTHSTIGRWEQSLEEIPDWVTERLLGTSQVQLSLDELHQLLDHARERKLDFRALLSTAIRSYLQSVSFKNIRTPLALDAVVATADQLMDRVAEPDTAYPSPEPRAQSPEPRALIK
jgi:transcriptional regulator with XRE-family HTH domain